MSETIRSFIAVEIENKEVLNKIIRVRDQIYSVAGDSIKPVEDENIHITIRFLGEIDQYTLNEMKKLLDQINMNRFLIHVKGLGGFPNLSRPRVLWVGVVEGSDELIKIRRFIDEKSRGLRIFEDQHQFHPHITIARVKTSIPSKASQILVSYVDEDFGFSEVTKIVLKKSVLTPRGPIYSDLHVKQLI